MRVVRLAGPVLFLAGVAALAVGFLRGEATLSLFVFFPVITAKGAWAILGIVLMITGFLLFFVSWPAAVETPPVISPMPAAPPSESAAPTPLASRRRWGGVLFLGPVPVVFGSDQKVTRWMLILGILLFVGLVVLTVISLRGI